MQVNETINEGLKRAYAITVGAKDIDAQIEGRLTEISKTVRLPGFRPGKAPMALLRSRYKDAVMGEVLDKVVREAVEKTLSERKVRPAGQPDVEITKFESGADLEFTVKVETMPEIGDPDFSKISIERPVAEVSDASVEDALKRIAEGQTTSEAVTAKRKSKAGDIAVIDFHGTIGGKDLPGGQGTDHHLELGSGSFIPGFEDQLIGAKAGDEVTVNVTFPTDYHAEDLAGKDASFRVNVKELRESKPAEVNDDLAKAVGMETLDTLKTAVREQLAKEYATVSRSKTKHALMDALADAFSFPVPESIVTGEFDEIWKQVEHAKEHGHLDEDDKGKSDDDLKAEYSSIAERRVRLGLLLSEVGRKAGIQVAPDDINKAILAEAAKYPGQEQAVFGYYAQNKEARESLHAPIFEEKVIDYVLELAKVTDKAVSVEELYAENATPKSGKKSGEKKAAKKSAAKKDDAEAGGDESAEKAPAKKAAAKKSSAKKD